MPRLATLAPTVSASRFDEVAPMHIAAMLRRHLRAIPDQRRAVEAWGPQRRPILYLRERVFARSLPPPPPNKNTEGTTML